MNALLELCQDLVGRKCEPHCTDEDTERSNKVPKVTQLESSRARTQTQLCVTSALHLLPQPHLGGHPE